MQYQLFKAATTLQQLPPDVRRKRIEALGPALSRAFCRKNRGRRCDVRAGREDLKTGECTLLEDVVLEDVSLVECGSEANYQLMFEVSVRDAQDVVLRIRMCDITDVIFR